MIQNRIHGSGCPTALAQLPVISYIELPSFVPSANLQLEFANWNIMTVTDVQKMSSAMLQWESCNEFKKTYFMLGSFIDFDTFFKWKNHFTSTCIGIPISYRLIIIMEQIWTSIWATVVFQLAAALHISALLWTSTLPGVFCSLCPL